jgi:hypothetical protein
MKRLIGVVFGQGSSLCLLRVTLSQLKVHQRTSSAVPSLILDGSKKGLNKSAGSGQTYSEDASAPIHDLLSYYNVQTSPGLAQ